MWPRTWPGLPDDGDWLNLKLQHWRRQCQITDSSAVPQWVRAVTDWLNFTDEVDWNWVGRCFLQGPDRSARQVVTAVAVEAERLEILRSQPHAKQPVHRYGFSRRLWLMIERSWCRARWAGCHENSLRPVPVVLRVTLRLQTLVYDILPSITAVFSYAIGS